MSHFQDLRVFCSQRNYAHAALNNKTEREPVILGMRITPLGFRLRVIVNEKLLNIEITTSSVLSVLLLING